MVKPCGSGANALIFDPFAGVSGDMILGALIDLGLSAEWLAERVEAVSAGAGTAIGLTVERVDRSGIECGRVRLDLPEETRHRHLADVLEIVGSSGLEAQVAERAAGVFRRIAEAEAAIHGVDVERVHFHEVGALDSIVDVVCAVAGVDRLGYRHFFTRPIGVGTGTVEIAHGSYPLPAPATARLLAGLPVRETGYGQECTTPTGAALVAELTEGRRAPTEVVWGRSGFGAGSRDPEGRPNALRLIECRVEASDAAGPVRVLQADIDDLSPEYVAAARDTLLEAGAVDVTLTRTEMKKGRSAVRVEALVPVASMEAVVDALFRSTTTIGLRHWSVERVTLERAEERVEWRGHTIRIKMVTLPGGEVRRKPEFDDIVAAARKTGLTPHEVRLELDAAGRGSSPGQ